jgi:hypothetical protein
MTYKLIMAVVELLEQLDGNPKCVSEAREIADKLRHFARYF